MNLLEGRRGEAEDGDAWFEAVKDLKARIRF